MQREAQRLKFRQSRLRAELAPATAAPAHAHVAARAALAEPAAAAAAAAASAGADGSFVRQRLSHAHADDGMFALTRDEAAAAAAARGTRPPAHTESADAAADPLSDGLRNSDSLFGASALEVRMPTNDRPPALKRCELRRLLCALQDSASQSGPGTRARKSIRELRRSLRSPRELPSPRSIGAADACTAQPSTRGSRPSRHRIPVARVRVAAAGAANGDDTARPPSSSGRASACPSASSVEGAIADLAPDALQRPSSAAARSGGIAPRCPHSTTRCNAAHHVATQDTTVGARLQRY
jgi:hypothetical protein